MLTSIRGALTATLLAGTMLAATPAFADETDAPSAITVSGSAAVVSQYRFRGIAQSNNKPAVQASISVSHESGFYISTWGSSTAGDATDTPIAPGGTEIDVYGGWAKELGGVKVDLGGYGYIYPNAPAGNLYEIYGSVAGALGPVTAKFGINYAPDQTNLISDNVYVYGELSGGIPGTPISLHGHLGYTDGSLAYVKNYLDWSVGASVTWKNLTLDASVVGTNVSRADSDFYAGCGSWVACSEYYHRPAKTVGVISLTASF
ncbi:MAG: TorF family putative porin [Novosphingobium sp.]